MHDQSTETLDLEGTAKLLRLGVEATRELIATGKLPAVQLNQKHTCVLREAAIEYLREEGLRQALERRKAHEAITLTIVQPKGTGKPAGRLPDLSGYETAAATKAASPRSKRAGSRSVSASAGRGGR